MTALGSAPQELLSLAGAGHPRPAIDLVLRLLADGMEVDTIITEVLAPVQLESGARWEANLWGVAEEHVATAVIDGVLGALALRTPLSEPHRGQVLVACAEGEHHTTPARMGAELLRSDGWEVTFLGGSLPADDLARYARVAHPDVVVISCTVPLSLPGARRGFAAIAGLGLPGIAAGQAFGDDDVRARRLGASGSIGSGGSLTATLDQVRTHEPQPVPTPTPTPPEVFALKLATSDLQRSCLSIAAERVPEVAAYSPDQLASTRTDLGRILDHLATSVDLGDDAIFADFTAWSARVLEVRGEPVEVLDRTLAILGEVLASAGLTEAARLCAEHDPRPERRTDPPVATR